MNEKKNLENTLRNEDGNNANGTELSEYHREVQAKKRKKKGKRKQNWFGSETIFQKK